MSTGGIPADLEGLYNQHALAVYRQALAWTRDPAWAEDVVADVFVRAHETAPPFRHAAQARRWLVVVARRLYLDSVRRQARDLHATHALGEATSGTASDWAAATVDRLWLRSLVAGLSPEQQAVLRQRFQLDKSAAEMADALGISPEAARARLHRTPGAAYRHGASRGARPIADDQLSASPCRLARRSVVGAHSDAGGDSGAAPAGSPACLGAGRRESPRAGRALAADPRAGGRAPPGGSLPADRPAPRTGDAGPGDQRAAVGGCPGYRLQRSAPVRLLDARAAFPSDAHYGGLIGRRDKSRADGDDNMGCRPRAQRGAAQQFRRRVQGIWDPDPIRVTVTHDRHGRGGTLPHGDGFGRGGGGRLGHGIRQTTGGPSCVVATQLVPALVGTALVARRAIGRRGGPNRRPLHGHFASCRGSVHVAATGKPGRMVDASA